MKLAKSLLVYVICFSLIMFSNSQLSLLAYGDIGEFEEFKDSRGSTDSDASVFKLDETAKTCTKLTGSWRGFLEFQTLVQKDIGSTNKFACNADFVVILGDLIYPEIKHLTDKTLRAIKILKTEARYAGWRARVVCAFYVLKEVLKTITCPANTKNPFGLKDANGLYTNFDLILGNHSYDVDYQVETDETLKTVNYKGYVFNTATPPTDLLTQQTTVSSADMQSFPVMQTKVVGGVRVEFLDLNVMPLYCMLFDNPNLTEEQFNKCFLITQYGVYHSFQNAKTYLDRFILAVKSFTSVANWRVIRAHHPVMNIDGYPADNSWFWTIPVDASKNTLMDLMKQSNVNILLASHHHSSQILAYPWSSFPNTKTTYSSLKASETIGIARGFDFDLKDCGGSECLTTSPKCYFNDIITNGSTRLTTCDETPRTINFKHNAAAPRNLITLVQGGSGRQLDNLQIDQRTPAALLFARAVNHGAVHIQFNLKTFTATYFEGDKVYLTFNTIDNTQDSYPVLEKYVAAKLDGSLKQTVNSVESLKLFNYTQHVDPNSAGYLSLGLISFLILLFTF